MNPLNNKSLNFQDNIVGHEQVASSKQSVLGCGPNMKNN